MKTLDHVRTVIAFGWVTLLAGCVATPAGDPPAKGVAVAETLVTVSAP